MITLIVVLAVIALVGIWALLTYNRFIALNVSAQEGAAEVDVQLKRRHDLIPNLIETVKGYAGHERKTLEQVTEARGAAISAQGTPARAEAESGLSRALGGLLAIAEAYPQLRASENFGELQRELAATEDRIQAARRFYNDEVEALNTKVQSVPSNVIAGLANFAQRDFFELKDRSDARVPSVSF